MDGTGPETFILRDSMIQPTRSSPANSVSPPDPYIIEEPIMATNQASRILPKLIVAATATGGTIFACHHLESQRRILDDKSDGCTSSTISGALTSLQSKSTSSLRSMLFII